MLRKRVRVGPAVPAGWRERGPRGPRWAQGLQKWNVTLQGARAAQGPEANKDFCQVTKWPRHMVPMAHESPRPSSRPASRKHDVEAAAARAWPSAPALSRPPDPE